ncbi:MAG TPA: 5-formyltetrahydrofolate cyclo-ligase [Pseudonocardiaceae bacterium]
MSDKSEWRRRLAAARREIPARVRAAEAAALAGVALPAEPSDTVCAYWPVGSEPGSPELLEDLVRRGCRVLLPVLQAGRPLDWAQYTGPSALRTGPRGLREPDGPRLGCAAISSAVLILVPALAVDWQGVRLGRGGGYYDRTLPLATPGTALVAIVRDEEVVPALPARPHDVSMTAALTPQRGLFPLGLL